MDALNNFAIILIFVFEFVRRFHRLLVSALYLFVMWVFQSLNSSLLLNIVFWTVLIVEWIYLTCGCIGEPIQKHRAKETLSWTVTQKWHQTLKPGGCIEGRLSQCTHTHTHSVGCFSSCTNLAVAMATTTLVFTLWPSLLFCNKVIKWAGGLPCQDFYYSSHQLK